MTSNNKKDNYFELSKLIESCFLRDMSKVDELIDNGALDGTNLYRPFPVLFDHTDYEMCDYILDKGVSIYDYNSLLPSYLIYNDEAYWNWVAEGVDIFEPEFENIFYLIDRGIYLNSVTDFKDQPATPLDIAEKLRQERVAKYLRKHGAKRYSELTEAEVQQGIASLENP